MTTRRRRALGAGGVSLSTAALVAFGAPSAKSQAPASAPPSTTPEVVVTGQAYSDGSSIASGGLVVTRPDFGLFGPTSQQDLPLSISSIPQVILRDQQAQTLFDAVRNDPSVTVTLPTSRSGSDDIVIRGFDANNPVEYRIDDLPLSPQSGVLLQDFERIDIYKGVAGLLYGFSAPGGSVNFISKLPLDGALTEVRGDYASRTQFGGAVDFSRRFGPQDQFGLRLNVAGAGGGTEPEGSDRNNYLLAAAFDWRPVSHVRLWTNFSYTSDPIVGTQPGFAVGPGLPFTPRAPDNDKLYSPDFEHHIASVAAAEGGFNADLLPWLTARGAVGNFKARRDVRGGEDEITDYLGDYIAFVDPHNHWLNEDTSGELDLAAHHDFGLIHERLDLGFTANQEDQFEHDVQKFTPVAGTFNLGGVTSFPDPNGPDDGDNGTYHGHSRYRNYAVLETLDVGPWATLLVGGAYSTIRQAADETPTGDYNQGAATPTVGLVLKPMARLSVYASYLQGLQPGAQASDTFGTAPVTNANAFTPASITTQYEVGMKWAVTPGLQANFALFRIEEPNAIYQPNDAADTSYTFANDGEQVNEGGEFTLIGQLVPGLTTFSGVTLLDPRITASQGGTLDGKIASGVPRVRANLSGEYALPFLQSLSVLGGVYYTSREYIATDDSLAVPSYATVDLGLKYALALAGRPSALRVYVQNVAAHDYWVGQPNGSISVGDPRVVRVDLSSRF